MELWRYKVGGCSSIALWLRQDVGPRRTSYLLRIGSEYLPTRFVLTSNSYLFNVVYFTCSRTYFLPH